MQAAELDCDPVPGHAGSSFGNGDEGHAEETRLVEGGSLPSAPDPPTARSKVHLGRSISGSSYSPTTQHDGPDTQCKQ